MLYIVRKLNECKNMVEEFKKFFFNGLEELLDGMLKTSFRIRKNQKVE